MLHVQRPPPIGPRQQPQLTFWPIPFRRSHLPAKRRCAEPETPNALPVGTIYASRAPVAESVRTSVLSARTSFVRPVRGPFIDIAPRRALCATIVARVLVAPELASAEARGVFERDRRGCGGLAGGLVVIHRDVASPSPTCICNLNCRWRSEVRETLARNRFCKPLCMEDNTFSSCRKRTSFFVGCTLTSTQDGGIWIDKYTNGCVWRGRKSAYTEAIARLRRLHCTSRWLKNNIVIRFLNEWLTLDTRP